MANLIPLSDLVRDRNYDFKTDNVYDPTGDPAYGSDGHKIGTVRGAMVDPDSGKLRYLIVDVGGWFVSKEVLVPVGMARIEDDAVYFDNLTKDQVKDMREYRAGEDYDYNSQQSDERVLRGSSYSSGYSNASNDTMTTGTGSTTDRDLTVMGGATELSQTGTTGAGYNAGSTSAMSGNTSASDTGTTSSRRYNYRDEDTSDTMFKTPQRLQLLEERLTVDKDRYKAGSVEIGKHVETRQQQVNVDLQHEEVVIERHPVSGSQPVSGNVQLGGDSQTIKVDLEAERADVHKQAYVTEEVDIGKRSETETRTFTESVGREVLDVNKTGDVDVTGTGNANMSGSNSTSSSNTSSNTSSTSGRDNRNLLEKTGDAIDRGVDSLDGKIDRPENK